MTWATAARLSAATAAWPSLPRVELIPGPTPLQAAPRLSDALGIEVWLKRDDLTGTGLGGNKVRALEYLVGDALARGADCFVTGAGPQSNWAMLAALVARQHGLHPHLVYYGNPRDAVGNHALAELAGAEVHFTGSPLRTSVDAALESLTAELTSAGWRPYSVPRGGATALGSMGYARAAVELGAQCAEAGVVPAQVWLATGSCGTQAGLLAGTRWLGAPHRVIGVTVSRPAAECAQRIATLASGAMALGLPTGTPQRADDADVDDIAIVDGHGGPGYGLPSDAGDQATRLAASTAGIFLDPVFGAKAMAALIDAARKGRADGPAVFLVSGGAPTLFTVRKEQA